MTDRPYFLTTPRLGFRSWRAGDMDLALSLWGDPRVMALIDGRGQPGREEVHERLERELRNGRELGIQYWPIFSLESGELVGCAGLKPYDVSRGLYEMGYHLRPEFWGAGYATEAARAVVAYAFATIRPAALLAGHHPENYASKRVLEKLGFIYLRDELYAAAGRMDPIYELKPPAVGNRRERGGDACGRGSR
ncbi:MAG TPA: GNAT family N-acetyltransferase [Longimicrobiales bacterium]|nr:GNAT family N-acetyltransferase [Longimicrobiales bacterium]